jgi:para-aminobenzoate synthetase component 1
LSIEHYIPSLSALGPLVFLESQSKDHRESHNHFLAAKPKGEIMLMNDQCWVNGSLFEVVKYGFPSIQWVLDSSKRWHVATLESTSMIWDLLNQVHQNRWLFGYLGYDVKNAIETLESSHPSLNNAPDLWLMEPEILLKYTPDSNRQVVGDDERQTSKQGAMEWVLGDKAMLESSLTQLGEEGDVEKASFSFNPKQIMDKDSYIDKVKSIQHDIHEGSYYEMNLSHALAFEFEGSAWGLYQAMKEHGPVPFGTYMELHDLYGEKLQVCCASPERYLAKRGSTIWSEPIKGTVGRDSKEFGWIPEQVREELLSAKNKAEHLMIVDLVRNDLHRVAKNGSVKVDPLFEIQEFETVYQLVSKVIAEVNPGVSSFEVIRNSFPMGSMTGAPKIAAMKAIERFEEYKRGIYSGAIGYLSPEGDFDFNVVIRTAIIQGQNMIYPVGGAITSDSDPEGEWDETLVKAQALHHAYRAKP